MTEIMKKRWAENQDALRAELERRTDLNECDYKLLVKLAFENIYNRSEEEWGDKKLDLDRITEIDDGQYQGTLLFVIPFNTYQPSEYEYIMTYVGYGSCSGCDALQAAQDWAESDAKLTECQVVDFMSICKDIVANAIKPYNAGWRKDAGWFPTEMEG